MHSALPVAMSLPEGYLEVNRWLINNGMVHEQHDALASNTMNIAIVL